MSGRTPTPMKLAVTSGAFARSIERGDLTQLEFVDLCARELACDGVVLDVRHFPRIDADYLAQLAKTAADRGLTVAALADSQLLLAGEDRVRATLDLAAALGAPLVAAPAAAETSSPWSDQLARLGTATGLAKRANVTIALRNAPGTFAATDRDCKRVAKETDSAWLRYGLEPDAFGTASDASSLAPNTVLLWSDVSAAATGGIIATFDAFLGHVVLDARDGDASASQMKNAMRTWRIALSERELNRT